MNIPNILLSLISKSGATKSISTALGLPEEKADQAVAASVPTLLAAFSGIASNNQGAQQLQNVAAQQDTGILDNLGSTLSSRGPQLADQGSTMLGSLLGGQSSMLGNILSRFTGVGEGSMGKILGMLTPIILGFLGKQASGSGTGGLATLLAGQKENIKSSLPAGLASMLPASLPGLGNLFGTVDQPGEVLRPARTIPASEESSYSARSTTPVAKSSPARWALPVALVLGLLVALPFLFNRNRNVEVPSQTIPSVKAPATRDATLPEAAGIPARSATGAGESGRFVSESTRLVSEATATLAKVQDTASAEAAVPTLKDINSRFASLKSSWSSMPETARGSLQSALSPLASRLEATAQPLLATPAVGNIIQPHVNELLGHVKSFTEAGPALPAPIQ